MAILTINWRPDRRQLRQFGAAAMVFFGCFGAWLRWKHELWHHPIDPATAATASVVLWCVAGACALAALVLPGALRPLYLGLTAVSFPFGFVISHVVMAFLYFVVLLPIGALMRLFGRDPLSRGFNRAAPSYWAKRTNRVDSKRYFKQY
jgi:hypothetical protein